MRELWGRSEVRSVLTGRCRELPGFYKRMGRLSHESPNLAEPRAMKEFATLLCT